MFSVSWFGMLMRSQDLVGISESDRMYTALPLYHSAALVVGMATVWYVHSALSGSLLVTQCMAIPARPGIPRQHSSCDATSQRATSGRTFALTRQLCFSTSESSAVTSLPNPPDQRTHNTSTTQLSLHAALCFSLLIGII